MVSSKQMLGLSITAIFIIFGTVGYLFKQEYDSLLEATSEGFSLGKTYGKMVNQSGCMFGLIKYASCTTTECELSANGYITGCMKVAKQDDFCSNVPNIEDTENAINWVSKTCAENNLGNNKCHKYMHKYVHMCTEQIKGKKLSVGEIFESGAKKGIQGSLK